MSRKRKSFSNILTSPEDREDQENKRYTDVSFQFIMHASYPFKRWFSWGAIHYIIPYIHIYVGKLRTLAKRTGVERGWPPFCRAAPCRAAAPQARGYNLASLNRQIPMLPCGASMAALIVDLVTLSVMWMRKENRKVWEWDEWWGEKYRRMSIFI